MRTVIELPSAATDTIIAGYGTPATMKLTSSGAMNPWPWMTTWSPPAGFPRLGCTELMASWAALPPRKCTAIESDLFGTRAVTRPSPPDSETSVAVALPPVVVRVSSCFPFSKTPMVVVNVTEVPSGTVPLSRATSRMLSLIPATLGLAERAMAYAVGVGCFGAVGLLCEQPTSAKAPATAKPTKIGFRFMVVSRICYLRTSRRRS